jgi:hypothetical protein
MMKFTKSDSKPEILFQGFVMLFQTQLTNQKEITRHKDDLVNMVTIMLMDPEITHEVAQAAIDRAIKALTLEKLYDQ